MLQADEHWLRLRVQGWGGLAALAPPMTRHCICMVCMTLEPLFGLDFKSACGKAKQDVEVQTDGQLKSSWTWGCLSSCEENV